MSETRLEQAWVFSGGQRLPVPTTCSWLAPPALPAVADVRDALAAALQAPVGSPTLRMVAAGASSAAITVPDLSRDCPTELVLPALLDELNAAGLPDERIVILVGCGLHRITTDEEKRRLVGAASAARVRVVDAQGIESPLVDLGRTAAGCPVQMHAEVATAGVVVSVGVLEPHQYAGYSGGVKGVAIGCAGEPTIGWTHRPAVISQAHVELCRLAGNPFQQTLREVAGRTRLAFAVNAVMDEGGGVAGIAAGDPTAVQEHLADAFGRHWLQEVPEPCDVVVAGIKAPKHENLYQASRAATYIGLAARPALRRGGLLLLCADLPNGPGDGPGELNFARVLADADPETVMRHGLEGPLGPGGQRAFVMARVLRSFRVGVCGPADAGMLSALGISSYRSIAEGLADARTRHGHAPDVLAVADALTTIVRAAAL